MSTLRTSIPVLALALCAAAALGLTNPGAVLAGIASGSADDCSREAPCSGVPDECSCPCCPLPALGVAPLPMPRHSRSTPVRPAAIQAPASAARASLDHPPE